MISQKLANITNPKVLELSGNTLNSANPRELGNMAKLQFLVVSNH